MTETRKISELKNWENNPRDIKPADFERLKNQIKKLGIYKPLLINKDNIVLGGNMRLRAYKELGVGEVEVTVVDAQTEAKMFEYALSDNDSAGYWAEQDLVGLIESLQNDFKLDDYKLNLGEAISLDQILDKFDTSEDVARLDKLNDKEVECPECGAKFKT